MHPGLLAVFLRTGSLYWTRAFWPGFTRAGISLLLVSLACGTLLAPGEAASAQLTASWVDNSHGSATTRLERRRETETVFAAIADVPPGVTTYVDASVTAGVRYCYRALAYDVAGASSYSNEACGTPASGPSPLSVTVTKAGNGTGTVSSVPAGIFCGPTCAATYPAGTPVVLTASPAGGSTFVGWSGACNGPGDCVLVGNTSVSVTATFGLTGTGTTDFVDVPASHPFFEWIDALVEGGITLGCSTAPSQFCPDSAFKRREMAVWLLRGMHGSDYLPPAATGVFIDVPVSEPFARWIEQLFAEGIAAGCDASPRYCPDLAVTRGQMAVFLLRAKHGAGYTPPPATGAVFADVPPWHPFARWIEALEDEDITGGCASGPARFCPDSVVTRGQMAVFLVRAFNLPM
jgi:hypothetical protein